MKTHLKNNYCIISEGESFSPSLEVTGCFLEYDSKVLYIKRSPGISQGNTWCIPGGKIEKGETALDGVIREVFEEVGLKLKSEDIGYIGKLQIRRPEIDYIFHIFVSKCSERPNLNLCLNECSDAQWLTIDEIKQLVLVRGGEEVLERYQEWSNNSRNIVSY